MKKHIRYIARIIMEADSPLSIGGNGQTFLQDSPVAKDFNGLPFIPGTSLAGYLRNVVNDAESYFGKHEDEESIGSNIIISDALAINENGHVEQEPKLPSQLCNFHQQLLGLPMRDHVRIDHKGTAADGAKFDREIVYKGTRFKCEIELQLPDEDDNVWQNTLAAFVRNDFYVGGGQTNNFGRMKAISIYHQKFDLDDTESKSNYKKLSVDLNKGNELLNTEFVSNQTATSSNYSTIPLKLNGKDTFFLFASGIPDVDNDSAPYTENCITWDVDKPTFSEKPWYVIPGSSIKGILAHRAAWLYNKAHGNTIEKVLAQLTSKHAESVDSIEIPDDLQALEKLKAQLQTQINELDEVMKLDLDHKEATLFDECTATNNEAVRELFGYATDSTDEGKEDGLMGRVIVHDTWLSPSTAKAQFTHNKIDRYTGGTVDTALYGEKVLQTDELEITVQIHNSVDEEYKQYLLKALGDIENGRLALSSRSSKGHGIFQPLLNQTSDV